MLEYSYSEFSKKVAVSKSEARKIILTFQGQIMSKDILPGDIGAPNISIP